jgi:hypothetical protein
MPEDIKYGFKDSQFLAFPVISKEEDILLIVQCSARTNRNKKFMGF